MLQIPDNIFEVQPKYAFGKASRERLATVERDLELICRVVANYQNISILCGHRNEAAQNAAYPKYSKVQWPNSKHNSMPSMAVDIAPWPIDWEDVGRFRVMAGRFLQVANMLGIDIRWGGDFNGDGLTNDRFIDLPHFELRKKNPTLGDLINTKPSFMDTLERKDTEVTARWAAMKSQLIQQYPLISTLAELQEFNTKFNGRLSYRSDQPGRDHWPTPLQVLFEGADDCDGYAIGKLPWLLHLNPRLVAVHDLVNGGQHMIVVVELEGKQWVLDSKADTIKSTSAYNNLYRPFRSFNLEHEFVHSAS